MKSNLALPLGCAQAKHWKLCASFTSNLHCLCGVVWYRTLRVNCLSISCLLPPFCPKGSCWTLSLEQTAGWCLSKSCLLLKSPSSEVWWCGHAFSLLDSLWCFNSSWTAHVTHLLMSQCQLWVLLGNGIWTRSFSTLQFGKSCPHRFTNTPQVDHTSSRSPQVSQSYQYVVSLSVTHQHSWSSSALSKGMKPNFWARNWKGGKGSTDASFFVMSLQMSQAQSNLNC